MNLGHIFSISNLRFIHELRGSPLSRFFYNKPTILLDEFGRYLSYYSPRFYFAEVFLIIFFPFWLAGIVELITRKNWKIFAALFLAGIPVYLIDKKDFISFLPIGVVYAYITYVGLKFVTKRWRK